MDNKELGDTAVCMEGYAWKGLDKSNISFVVYRGWHQKSYTAKNAKTLNPLLDTLLGGCRTFGVNWLAADLRGRVRVPSMTCSIMAGSTLMSSPPTRPPPALHYAVSAAEKIVIQQEGIFASAVLRSAASTSHLRIILLFRCHSLVAPVQ